MAYMNMGHSTSKNSGSEVSATSVNTKSVLADKATTIQSQLFSLNGFDYSIRVASN